MSFTFPLQLPSQGFVEFVWEPDSAVGVQKAEFTLTETVYVWEGQARRCTVRVPPIHTMTTAKAWMVWLLKLNTREGTFYLQDPVGHQSRGNVKNYSGYTPLVNGASQDTESLVTDGWPVSVTDLFLPGDWISIADRLHMVLDAVTSDASGNATLNIWPFARRNLADNAPILVGAAARGVFQIIDNTGLPFDVHKIMDGFSFSAQEIIDPADYSTTPHQIT
jgi:hypothetical protein